jgi:predicted aspartyl protease
MTPKGNGAMGRVAVEVEVASNVDVMLADLKMIPPEKIRRTMVRGFVDTGSTRLVLPATVVAQLGLTPSGKTRVRYADQRAEDRDAVENVWLQLLGRHGIFSAIVEPSREDALIGAIVMEELDLLVDCGKQTVVPRDPHGTISEVE